MLLVFRIEIQYIENKHHIFEILRNNFTKIHKNLNYITSIDFINKI